MATLGTWLERLRGLVGASSVPKGVARTAVAQRDRPAEPEWALVASVGAGALGGMYADLLRQAGIPVLAREWGAGSAVFGGVPVGVRLFVPQTRLAQARAVLHLGETTEGEEDEG